MQKKAIIVFQTHFGLDAIVYDMTGDGEFSYDPSTTWTLFKVGEEVDLSKVKMLAAISGYDSFMLKEPRTSRIPDLLLDDPKNPSLLAL